LTRKFRSLPQFGQVNVTHHSPAPTIRGEIHGSEPSILCNGAAPAQCKIDRDMATYQVHTEAHGPHWVAWITRDGGGKPYQSVVLIARTREEAEARGQAWAARASD
jgi:hypothetical protein